MRFPKNTARDREIFEAFQAGTPTDQLTAHYNLTEARIAVILTAERHKIAVSLEPGYRELRERSRKN